MTHFLLVNLSHYRNFNHKQMANKNIQNFAVTRAYSKPQNFFNHLNFARVAQLVEPYTNYLRIYGLHTVWADN